jgi:hypothetical protein
MSKVLAGPFMEERMAASDWLALNDKLRDCDLLTAEKMLDDEIMGKKRLSYMLRIKSRRDVLRNIAERAELTRHAAGA